VFDSGSGYLSAVMETPGTYAFGNIVHVRLEREALSAGGWSHLVALVESNGSHRHCG
jgi:hypothetical protein